LTKGTTIIGALFLRPFLLDINLVGSAQLEMHYSQRLVWFSTLPQAKLKRLMLEFVGAMDVELSRLYFYYRGTQVNPYSKIIQVSVLMSGLSKY
jgi:hypothetical protein